MLLKSEFIQRLVLKPRGHVEKAAISAGLIAVATALRWLINRGMLGVPFSTYYPAVMIAALLLDWRYALAVTITSALVINELYFGPGWFAEFGLARTVLFGFFAFSSGLLILTGTSIRRLLAEIDDLMERQAGFNVELQHRIKNSLAIVQAMASQGARAPDPAEFYRTLSGRIGALAKANELLSLGREQDCRLPNLVEEAVAPFRHGGQFRIGGPACVVPLDSCVPMVMALHELSTNAVKHGALSVPTGEVDLHWRLEGDGADRQLVVTWRESGGPAVCQPTHRGLGSRLLLPQKGIAGLEVQFPADGVTCQMQIRGAMHPA